MRQQRALPFVADEARDKTQRLAAVVRFHAGDGERETHLHRLLLRAHLEARRQGVRLEVRRVESRQFRVTVGNRREQARDPMLQLHQRLAPDHGQGHQVGGVVAAVKRDELLARAAARFAGVTVAQGLGRAGGESRRRMGRI